MTHVLLLDPVSESEEVIKRVEKQECVFVRDCISMIPGAWGKYTYTFGKQI